MKRTFCTFALLALAALSTVAGLVAIYVRTELAQPEPFAERAVATLDDRAVRAVIAERVAVELLEREAPDLVASRPLVLTGIEAILQTDEFSRVMRRSAATAHEVLLEGDSDVVVELEQSRTLIAGALEATAPQVARSLPRDIRPEIARLRRSDATTTAVRLVDSADTAAYPLLIAGFVLMLLAVATARERRRALAGGGAAVALAAVLAVGGLGALRAQAVAQADQVGLLTASDARVATGAAWDALAGDLRTWLLATAAIGAVLMAGGLLAADSRVDRAGVLRRAGRMLVGPAPLPVLLLRGLVLTAIGMLLLVGYEPLRVIATAAVGAVIGLVGLTELVAMLPDQRRRRDAGAARRRRRLLVAAGTVVAVVAAVTGAVLLLVPDDEAPRTRSRDLTTCNGLEQLCGRRLDEVVFPGTHNSMSAADRPGWFFANQVRPIPRQLDDGIRLLMIDAHYGVVDDQGRVRTDLRRERTDRNRAAGELGEESVRVAERLAGRLGLVPARGEHAVFLCHTLCELGAERMSKTLASIREFLHRQRSEVVIVFVESAVDATDVEREFKRAGLEPYLATLPDDGRPLPTLGDLITSGRRLVVVDQDDGGNEPWYRPAFRLMQETVVADATRAPTSCRPGRGAPTSPLLLANHWVDRFPPPATANRRIAARRTLLERSRECRRRLGRRPNAFAVDFYEDSDVIGVARTLNRRGPR